MEHLLAATINYVHVTLYKGRFSVQKKGQRSQSLVATPEDRLGQRSEVPSSKSGPWACSIQFAHLSYMK